MKRRAHRPEGRATSEPDEVLMERFQQGDTRAFDTLFVRHSRPLRSYLRRLLGARNEVLVEDIHQSTFLSVVRARERFRPGIRVRPWLYTIATNLVRDFQRRGQEQLTATGELPAMDAELPVLADARVSAALHQALSQLPESSRNVVVLHAFEGLRFVEIAEALDLTPGAVRVRAHRAYARLRSLLRPLWKGE